MDTGAVQIHPPLVSFLQPERAAQLVSEGLFSDHLAGLRAVWPNVCSLWAMTVDRARSLSPDRLDERVAGEWSFLETLRHLVFVTDAWIGGVVREQSQPHHPWGVAPHFIPDAAQQFGLDPDARPGLDELLAVRHERADAVAALLDELDGDESLQRVCAARGGQFSVVGALQTVFFEEWAHHSYAIRDLAELEGAP